MELIGLIVFLFAIRFIWNLFQSTINRFEIISEKDVKNIEGKNTIIIYIKGRGALPLSEESNYEVTFVSNVWDITNERESPVFCFIPEFQMNGMYTFKKTMAIPYNRTVIKDWVDLGFIVPEICIFPKSKNRRLKVCLSILNNSNKIVQTYSSITQFYNDSRGYEEIEESKVKFFKIKIQTLVKIAVADEKLDNREGYFISDKIRDFLKDYEGEKRESLKNEMNDLLKQSYTGNSLKKTDLYTLLSFFNKEATQADKYDLIKNCVEMMNIDEEINEKELKIIDEISSYLRLNYKKINELKDIHILKGSSLNFSNPESILGIKSSWSYTDIHSHLKKEFIKWNSRMQNCSNKKERDHIQYMLDLISEMRLKYEKKAG